MQRLIGTVGVLALLALGTVALSQAIGLTHAAPPGAGGQTMTDAQDRPEKQNTPQEERRPDGSRVVTTGHRYPDNVRTITREYGPQGQLSTARIRWSGFAGELLDLTVTFGPDGQVLKEEGYRAPGVTTSAEELLREDAAQAGA